MPIDDACVQTEVTRLKERLKSLLVEEALMRLPSSRGDDPLWREALYAAISTHLYGVIYWLNRSEASAYVELGQREPRFRHLVVQADRVLNGHASAVIDRAIFRLLTSAEVRLQVTSAALLAPQAVASIGRDEYLVRTADLVGWYHGALDQTSGIFDLHDFAHQICAAVNPVLFGNRYYPALGRLPAADRQLITRAFGDLIESRRIPKGSGF